MLKGFVIKLKLLIFLVALNTATISNAEWRRVSESDNGDVYYLDADKIRRQGESIYYWQLADFLEPNYKGYLSAETYIKGDCKALGAKVLTFAFYKLPMGRGAPEMQEPSSSLKSWTYPPPKTSMYQLLTTVCSLVNSK